VKAVLDAGALVAVDRRDRAIGAHLRVLQQRRTPIRVSSVVVGQVSGDGRSQASAVPFPGSPSDVAWTELGQIDHFGHDLLVQATDDLDQEIDKIARRSRRHRGQPKIAWRRQPRASAVGFRLGSY
jgi:hypothetical protein